MIIMDRAAYAAKQWQVERPDLDTKAMVILGRLGELSQLIMRTYLNPLFTNYGLQPGEFDVLATLRRSGEPYALTPTVLYDTAMISSGSMTNRINRLEEEGLVKRLSNPDDGRGFLVKLTDKGYTLIESMLESYVACQQNIVGCLNQQEQKNLTLLLEKLIKHQ